MEEKRRKQKPKRLWLKITLSVLLVMTIAIAGYAYSIYRNIEQTVTKEIHQPVTTIDTTVTKKKMKEEKPLNILLLGVDQRAGDSGRSDALMVLSLNPKQDKMQIISIPRDTRTEIIGEGYDDKINHAYAFGGTDMSINTVENFLDIELDYYVTMNMEGLADMVDAIGGITLTNELDWYDTGHYQKGFHYAKGELELDGPKTMGYVRMRYQDPNNDFGRTKRQRQVIEAILDKGASFGSVNKIGDMVDVLGENMATNMDFNDMKNLLLNYRNTLGEVVSYQIKGQGTYIETNGRDIYYLIVPDEEITKVHQMIAEAKS